MFVSAPRWKVSPWCHSGGWRTWKGCAEAAEAARVDPINRWRTRIDSCWEWSTLVLTLMSRWCLRRCVTLERFRFTALLNFWHFPLCFLGNSDILFSGAILQPRPFHSSSIYMFESIFPASRCDRLSKTLSSPPKTPEMTQNVRSDRLTSAQTSAHTLFLSPNRMFSDVLCALQNWNTLFESYLYNQRHGNDTFPQQ